MGESYIGKTMIDVEAQDDRQGIQIPFTVQEGTDHDVYWMKDAVDD